MSRHGFVYVAAAVTLAPLSSSAAFPVADPTKCRGWLAIIDGGAKALADLLRDWETITAKNDGDAVRRYLGTVGDSSPLSQLRPALQGVLRASDLPAAFDDGAFAEASEDVLADLRAAEGVAYGSNFADYSTSVGSGGLSPAATQIKQSRAYVLKAQRSYAALVATLEPLR
ncbi:hypothetical protein M885DRAFT_569103 [Pelagophyceae sp. CCMP2097]|nr:hypothetical protein M885DRAFT_569103 [Pelagophyceae sp. CCMP2097]